MSAESLRRLAAETEARLLAATDPKQVRAIHLSHLASLGSDLAETLFLHVKADSRFTDPEINALVLSNLFELVEGISETLRSNGIADQHFEEESRGAAGDAFLDRLEQLFEASEVRGTA